MEPFIHQLIEAFTTHLNQEYEWDSAGLTDDIKSKLARLKTSTDAQARETAGDTEARSRAALYYLVCHLEPVGTFSSKLPKSFFVGPKRMEALFSALDALRVANTVEATESQLLNEPPSTHNILLKRRLALQAIYQLALLIKQGPVSYYDYATAAACCINAAVCLGLMLDDIGLFISRVAEVHSG